MDETPLHLKFETATKYYQAILFQDLFGDWVIIRYWGGKKSNLGSYTTDFCESYVTAIEKLRELQKVRRAHAYREIVCQTDQ